MSYNQHKSDERPPLSTITVSGVYTLKMTKPKPEKVKTWEDGVSARLFFVTAEGQCLSKSYGTKYPKPLAMLVGKMSGNYTSEIQPGATAEDFIKYLEKACNKYVDVAVEVTLGDVYNGNQQYKYKLTWAKKGETLKAPDSF